MKNTIILIFLLTTSLFISSCIEDESPEIYTLSGILYQECSKIPMSNTSVVLWGYDGSVFQEDVTGVKGRTTTDENGNFTLTYEKVPRRVDLSLETPNGVTSFKILGGIPLNENINFGDCYISNRGSVIVTLEINEPYTNLDTLEIATRSTWTKYSGPFQNGIIDTITNINGTPKAYDLDLFLRVNAPINDDISWKIKTHTKFGDVRYYPTGCGVIDEVTIKIE